MHQQMLLPLEKLGYATVLFDNDFVFPANGIKSSAIWEAIDPIRFVKDEFFERMLTDEMKESFNA